MTSPIERQPTSRPPETLPVERPVAHLAEDLEAVTHGGVIRLFCGEANPSIYNDPLFLKAAEYAKSRRAASIHVSLSPLVAADTRRRNGLIELWKERVIEQVYCRPSRGAFTHFRVIPSNGHYRYYAEEYHPPLLPRAQRRALNPDAFSQQQFDRLAEEATLLFEGLREYLTEKQVSPLGRLPLLVVQKDLSSLVQIAEQYGRSFDHLSVEDLLSFPEAAALLHQ